MVCCAEWVSYVTPCPVGVQHFQHFTISYFKLSTQRIICSENQESFHLLGLEIF